MLRFASLGSGSKGNGTLVECGSTRILIDCGFTLAETEHRLHRLGCHPASLTAILVTHEHGDHANGVGRLARRYHIPVWLTVGTYHAVRDRNFPRHHFINIHQPFALDDLYVTPFPVPHDAREPSQFIFSDGNLRLAVLTDTGSYTPYMVGLLQGLDGLLLECNYDAAMLARGPYPYSLKVRVGGRYGHLDNCQATDLLRQLDHSKLQHVIGMHLSETNNLPAYAYDALCTGLGCGPEWLGLATQESGLDWRELR